MPKINLPLEELEEANRIIDRPIERRDPVTKLKPRQPKDKGLYKPRFNGIRHYYEAGEDE